MINWALCFSLLIAWLLLPSAVAVLTRWSSSFRYWVHTCQLQVMPWAVLGSTQLGTDVLYAVGKAYKDKLQAFYEAGIPILLLSFGGSMILLSYNVAMGICQVWRSLSQVAGETELVEDMALSVAIPGITIPFRQVGYLWLAIMISVVFHEVGHALAAASVGVRTTKIGFFVVLFFPGMYVQLDESERYANLPMKEQLKIVAAGVWHNAVLCILCLLLAATVPWLASVMYHHAVGACVVSMSPEVALGSVLSPGAIIVGLDDTPIDSVASWNRAVQSVLSPTAPRGFCVPSSILAAHAVSSNSACCNMTADPSALTCFSVVTDESTYANHLQHFQQVCMSARDNILASAVEGTRCFPGGSKREWNCKQWPSHTCVVPELGTSKHRVMAITVVAPATRRRHSYLYAGHPLQLYLATDVTDYTLRVWVHNWPWSTVLVPFLPVDAVDVFQMCIRFVFSVSASIALLNSAPIHFTDGCVGLPLLMRWVAPRVHDAVYPKFDWLLNAVTGLLALNVGITVVLSSLRG